MNKLSKIIFYNFWLIIALFSTLAFSCKDDISNGDDEDNGTPKETIFKTGASAGALSSGEITEASGLVNSRSHSDFFWINNDGGAGAENRIFLVDKTGTLKATYWLEGVSNIDWEDITLGPGPEEGTNYLYVGQIGDNQAQYDKRNVFRFVEPSPDESQFPLTDTISNIETITYVYPDGSRDAETLMIDPVTKDLYIVSKRESPEINIYVASYPQSTSETITLDKVGTLPFTQATAGDISKDGSEILIKNYTTIYYWKRTSGESVADALAKTATEIPYLIEPQGEAIAFTTDGTGFYTVSEEANNIEAVLYFYEREE
ncbi:hypothetical protein [Chondrinema litorale]|uniref:hypothetical protein n=1 Tax=Chondrinema litorale TaxID=2994555 RepID=UPI0025427964|nr:hypothetical protein [Chondrinema litorale]UZR94785.1 hypothetical protein OQ292_03025 [Chondrinema litorale]